MANHCYIIVADYGPRISGNEQKEIMGSQLARAWIETDTLPLLHVSCSASQLARAWIETEDVLYELLDLHVATRARAWIETAKLKCPRITEATESNWLLDIEIWSHPKQ